ncbi:hypothetical protein FSP39_007323 [Pinctada imbricata]|uniref:COR domain-containing protein n=1 Tax=Pinctada imbricata TaxID=66713 RepID=A0AA89BYZ5_PINIB|nr:hypothetical protein FSP39_007323 [Pinctada imbricata]
MLVGHFGVGKTTIAMQLLERKVKHIDSTDGIDVYINQCLYDKESRTWHTTDFLEFWISTIITYARGQQANYPKIVLIGTHRDQLRNDAALVGIKERISEQFGKLVTLKQLVVRDELFISARHMNDETRKIIRNIILEEGQQYPEFGERIPARWNALQEKLLQRRKDRQYVISMDDVKSMNKELPSPLDEEELEIFLSYLHNMGYILYFSSPALKEKIVLDPKFVINAMRSFITCKRFVKRSLQGNVWKKMRLTGQVKKTHILTTWRASGLEEHTEHLLGIMKKLDLVTEPMIYRSGKQVAADFFVVPCMINADKPEGCTVSRVEGAQFVLEFSADTILPPAVFNRLVCSCLALWEIFERHLYNGMVILKSGRYHIIKLDRQVDKIVVTISHTERKVPDIQLCRAMRQFLSETIDRIVSLYTTSSDSPICCTSSEIDADLEILQTVSHCLQYL